LSSLKEKYEKWELVATPIITLLATLLIFTLSQNFLGLEDSFTFFLFPFIMGFLIGIIAFTILDKFWLKVSSKSMSKFLRIPTYILGIVAIMSIILTNYDLLLSLFIIMTGMGAMASIINVASLITFYREFLKIEEKPSNN
jgi:hypothetical protein